MIRGFQIAVLIGLLLFSSTSCAMNDVSVSCMMAYEEGGAPAVLGSPECFQWIPSQSPNENCQFATLQGRREYQEDRVVCDLQFNVTFIGEDGPKEVEIGIAGIFDGHGGEEASVLASEKLFDYFAVHVAFASYQRKFYCKPTSAFEGKEALCGSHHASQSSDGGVPVAGDVLHKVLKVALLRTIRDIDIEFTKEAVRNQYSAGSTGTVVLLVDDQVLVAHVGDTKAILCSKSAQSEDTSTNGLVVEELTRDHHPDREDEKARIEAAGGYVRTWGVPRVNGILAVSRAIGDLSLKRYGVSPVPEVFEWRNVTVNNKFLVIASDGIFESLTPQEVCDLVEIKSTQTLKTRDPKSLADHIVKKAYEQGSGDNLSAILVQLQLSRCDIVESSTN